MAEAEFKSSPAPANPSAGSYNQNTLLAILSRIKGFSGLSQAQLARISRIKVMHWGPDEFIVREGSADLDKMVVILAGTVFIRKKVIKQGIKTYEQVAEIPGPTIIGENSFFTGLPRSAAVYAKDRIPGIPIDKENFMRMASLDKGSMNGFLRHIAMENLTRVERTAVLYMNTLQLILAQATIRKFGLSQIAADLRQKLEEDLDPLQMQEIVGEILMLLRRLNTALEELYGFANLPEVKVLSVDKNAFRLSKEHKFFDIYKNLVEEFALTQELVPLETVNFKDYILNGVISAFGDISSVPDYPALISLAVEAYSKFTKVYFDLGCQVKLVASPPSEGGEEEWPGSSLLWD